MSTTVIGRNVKNVYTVVPGTAYSTLCIDADKYSLRTVVDTKYVEDLKKFIWYRLNTDDGNYFATTLNSKTIKLLPDGMEVFHQVLLHRLVVYLARYPNPEGHPTVDHINRESLDNRAENLRWLSQADQNRNTDKRNRKVNARPLPDDITGPLPKYITWNVTREKTSGDNVLERKFFRIEKHPAQPDRKIWSSSKSSKLTNQEKLNQAKEELARLDALRDAPDPRAEKLLQEYFSLTQVHET